MKRVQTIFCVFLIAILLTSCWDQDYLKDAKLIYGAAFDLASEDGKILETIAIREVTGSGSQAEPLDELYWAVGHTIRELRDIVDRKVAGKFRPYKNRVLLIGEELAKRDLYPILDAIYRDPKSALNATIAVAQGRGADILREGKVGNTLISEHLDELVESEHYKTLIPKESIQTIFPELLDPGTDFGLPYIARNAQGNIEVGGIALFHNRRMTGLLKHEESMLTTLLLLLNERKPRVAQIQEKVASGVDQNIEQFLVADVIHVDRKWKITPDPIHKVKVEMPVKFEVAVVEYPKDQLDKEQEVKKLNMILSKKLTERVSELIGKLQEAHCDYLSIGRDLIAYHHDLWKQLDWEKDYPNIKFEPKVEVEIVSHGVFN